MTDMYRLRRVFRDDVTRLVVPNINIIKIDAITNILSSYITNPTRGSHGFFSPKDKFGNNPFTGGVDAGIMSLMTRIIDALVIGLGVTKIETSQEYTMPMSKGIGSTGEVIHLLGAKNEMINIEFTTDRYPGRLGYILRTLLQKILESTQVIYLVDDLFLATPCLVKKIKLSKQGNYRGAIMGELELVSLTTGGTFVQDTIGGNNKVSSYANKLRGGLGGRSKLTRTVVGVGRIAIGVGLIAGIAGYGS